MLKPEPGASSSDVANQIPYFEVLDASSISIKETEFEIQRSMAENGFTSTAIEASVYVLHAFFLYLSLLMI
jgi:hypothetical protein